MGEAVRDGVLVFGSLNMDLVARVPRMPVPGETLSGHSFFSNPGGKGANQAVACARQGARVEMVGRVGDDGFAMELRDALRAQGVDDDGVTTAAGQSTGVAMIMVNDAAQNCIAVLPGANALVNTQDAESLRARLPRAALLLLQLEVPMNAVLRAASLAREGGCRVLLNAAPAQALPDALWPQVDILVVNESEARILAAVPSVTRDNAGEAASLLRARGPAHVLITLGEDGVVWISADGIQHFEAMSVEAVDTTGAGDTFIGSLAALLVERRSMPDAIRHAMRAAAICVTRPGAQASIPTRQEVADFWFPTASA